MKIMKKGIFCVLVCMLMILGSVVPISGTIFTKEPSQLITQRNAQYDEAEKIFNDLKVKLESVTSKQEALVLVNEAIVELHEHGLLPKGMTVKRAQRIVAGCFLKSDLAQPFQSNNENNSGNTNCLVVGFANETFFRPFPTIYDIPIVYYLFFNTSFGDYFNFLIWFYVIRASQPVKLGPYAWVGGRDKLVENENVTYDSIHASSGWVWTLGVNGVQKWNGTFYGGLNTRYTKFIIDNDSYAESWDPVGIRSFVGINFFSIRTFWNTNKLPTFYIGFAREINFTYTPPWT
jgi:hypothetical protein